MGDFFFYGGKIINLGRVLNSIQRLVPIQMLHVLF